MCAPALTLALVVAAILSCEGSPHAHHGIFRWAPIPHQLPIDAMIEVVDRLTVDVMQDYAFSRGNFAFSPYGATSVLIALYEGSRGESSRQIHAALRLPWNHDAVRIGFRDLHRKLRVYFIHEGFLNGLTFNKNKTEFRPEYIRALRFYGYEVESATPASLPSTTESSTTTVNSTDISKPSTEPETISTPSSSSAENGTTSNGVVTTQELPKSTTASESTTGNPLVNETSETTDAITEKSMEVTTNVNYEPTTKFTSTEISDLTSQPSQATTIGITTVSENVQTTTEGVVSPETQRPSTATNNFTTDKEETSAGETTESIQTTVTSSDNSSVSSGSSEKTTEIGIVETTNSETTSEQTTVVSASSSTETPDLSTVKEIVSTNEPTTANPVSEEVTTVISETLETTTEKFISTPEEATTAPPTASATPTVQLTTDESTSESSAPSASTMPPTGDSATTNEIAATSDGTPPGSASGTDIETTTTVTDVITSSTELLTESVTTTSQTTEETGTPVSVANLDETTTNSEQTSNSGSTNTPDIGARSARNIFSSDSALWSSDFISFIRGVSAGETSRIEKRSIKEAAETADRRQGDFSLQLQNGMLDSSRGRGLQKEEPQVRLPFLVDGVLEEKVAVSTYTAVLPFAFVPRLDALALELPLENEWHRLVILLPLERRGLQELIYELGSVPLSHVLRSLHRTRVNAIIPNIVVEGFVVLTPTLQKLGIWDVFDPKRADLSGMSRDPDLYVRDLEQTLTVDISSKSRIQELPARAKSGRQRIEQFAALHPFLYFVVDRDTKVPLVAGKMVDPLNSRIH